MTPPSVPCHRRAPGRQRGSTLALMLVILAAVMVLGTTAARIALQNEKAARSERDRLVAFQAAEAALEDAQTDIDGSSARSGLFSAPDHAFFLQGCAAGADNVYLGLCAAAAETEWPAWVTVDFLDDAAATMRSVPYGRFTGQLFATGGGSLPARLPRYMIELIPYQRPGAAADGSVPAALYRITAIGFGMQDTTRVVLQMIYRKVWE